MSFPNDYDGAWNFEDDEEFLEYIRVSPWSGADRYTLYISPDDEERLMELYPTSIIKNEDHAFLSPDVNPTVNYPEITNKEFEMMVKESLIEDIQHFLSFSTPEQLIAFIKANLQR